MLCTCLLNSKSTTTAIIDQYYIYIKETQNEKLPRRYPQKLIYYCIFAVRDHVLDNNIIGTRTLVVVGVCEFQSSSVISYGNRSRHLSCVYLRFIIRFCQVVGREKSSPLQSPPTGFSLYCRYLIKWPSKVFT